MMKKLTLLLIMLFCSTALADVIVMQDGRIIENAKILKIGIEEIEYKVGERAVLYSARKSDVAKITYDDGGEDVFSVPATPVPDASFSAESADTEGTDLLDTVQAPVATIPAVDPEPTPLSTPEPEIVAHEPKSFKVSVYVTGVNAMIGGALSKAINTALVKSGVYPGIESIDQYISSAVNDNSISQAAKQADVGYVFVVNAGATPITVRIIDAETATVMAQVSIDGKVSAVNAAGIAKKIVDFILGSGPKPPPEAQISAGMEQARSEGREDKEKWRRKYAIGYSGTMKSDNLFPSPNADRVAGQPLELFMELEPYLRWGMGTNTRLYFGFSWLEISEIIAPSSEYTGWEYHFTGFWEWHTNNRYFNAYGGPGLMLGSYSYDLMDGQIKESGVGVALGVQGGAGVRLGWFLIGYQIRIAYYMRTLDNRTRGGFGSYLGVTF